MVKLSRKKAAVKGHERWACPKGWPTKKMEQAKNLQSLNKFHGVDHVPPQKPYCRSLSDPSAAADATWTSQIMSLIFDGEPSQGSIIFAACIVCLCKSLRGISGSNPKPNEVWTTDTFMPQPLSISLVICFCRLLHTTLRSPEPRGSSGTSAQYIDSEVRDKPFFSLQSPGPHVEKLDHGLRCFVKRYVIHMSPSLDHFPCIAVKEPLSYIKRKTNGAENQRNAANMDTISPEQQLRQPTSPKEQTQWLPRETIEKP